MRDGAGCVSRRELEQAHQLGVTQHSGLTASANAADEKITLHATAGTRKRRAIIVAKQGTSRLFVAMH